MEKEQNHFNNPIVIILLVALIVLGGYVIFFKNQNNTQPTQDNQNSQQVIDNSKNSQLNTSQEQPQQSDIAKTAKSMTDIVQEWRNSTAFIDCTFGNLPNNNLQDIWGSGLLVMLNSTPTVITNRHVVDNGKNNLDYCDIKFPGTIYSIGYMVNAQDQAISYSANGNDVAFITIPQVKVSFSQLNGIDSYSLNERSKTGSYACRNKLNIGDPVLIIGYPVYGSVSSLNFSSENIEVTATEGIVSGMDGVYYTTSAKVDHGNSGGLAIDEKNDCYFGIPTWDVSGGFESLGRILPASTFLHY